MSTPKNIFFQKFALSQNVRSKKRGHKPLLVWFTGISGSGKSTIANAVELSLFQLNIDSYILDGDNIRLGLNKDLSFDLNDRTENLRRVAEVAKLFLDSGLVVLASFVSPMRNQRANAKKIAGEDNFLEIFVNTPLEECERRDSKGLYERARENKIKDFTGISSPFECPISPDIEVKTTESSLEQIVKSIIEVILKRIVL